MRGIFSYYTGTADKILVQVRCSQVAGIVKRNPDPGVGIIPFGYNNLGFIIFLIFILIIFGVGF